VGVDAARILEPVRIDVPFSLCHPTFFACAEGLFLTISTRPS
jgi:hypothetical protein